MTGRSGGRPRLEPAPNPDIDPSEHILVVASRLFAERGFGSTTTREIARAAGIQQPSLFYWFPTKWAILDRLVASGIVESAAFARRVRSVPGPAFTRLYALLLFDTRQLLASPYDLSFLAGAPELRDERLTYRPHLRALRRTVQELVAIAVEEGDAEPIDPRFGRIALMGLAGSVMSWRRSGAPATERAEAIVRFAMRGLAAAGVDVDQVAAAAQSLSNPYSSAAVPLNS